MVPEDKYQILLIYHKTVKYNVTALLKYDAYIPPHDLPIPSQSEKLEFQNVKLTLALSLNFHMNFTQIDGYVFKNVNIVMEFANKN